MYDLDTMPDQQRTEGRIDRRTLLKGTAAATAGTGALLGIASGSAGAATTYEACSPDGSVRLHRTESCDEPPTDLVPNGECGVYLARCTHDGEDYLYIDWNDDQWLEGWVLEKHLVGCGSGCEYDYTLDFSSKPHGDGSLRGRRLKRL